MSDHVPFEIQIEIIKRLPVTSLIRFRSVSKPWKSLIDSTEFIADHIVRHSQPKRLFVSYKNLADSELICVLVDDDDTFPQRKCSVNVPKFFKLIKDLHILGSSHGLFCLYGYYEDRHDSFLPELGYGVVVLWNPAIRKSVVIKVPDELDFPYETVVGFGVCPRTKYPKLVKINCIGRADEWESISNRQVEVFTLSSGVWRTSYEDLPRKWINLEGSHVVIDGFIYWLASDHMDQDENWVVNHIISFDLTSEEFREIYLPDYLTLSDDYLLISKLRDSLVVVKNTDIDEKRVYGVWMMEHGVPNSFTKLFTIDVPDISLDTILGFRENCKPILDAFGVYNSSATLKVYEPSTKLIKDLGIYGESCSFSVSSYMETLMLLDQPDCCIYSNV